MVLYFIFINLPKPREFILTIQRDETRILKNRSRFFVTDPYVFKMLTRGISFHQRELTSVKLTFCSTYPDERGYFNVTYIFIPIATFSLFEMISFLKNYRFKI